MTQEFVNYEQALALKELGFDEPCFGGYDMETLKLWIGYLNDGEQFNREYYYPAPTFSQTFRFFRERHGLYSHIFSQPNGTFVWCIRWYVDGLQKDIPYQDATTWEEAEFACLIKLIEIVK